MRSAYKHKGRNAHQAARAHAGRRACHAAKTGREGKASGEAAATARPARQAATLDRRTAAPQEQAQTPEPATALTGTPDPFQNAGTPDLFQSIEAAAPDDSPPDTVAGTGLLIDAEAACQAAMPGLRSPGFRDLAARAQSPGGLAELAGTTIGAGIDAVGEAFRGRGREGAAARCLLLMEKSPLPIADRRRVERPGGCFRRLADIPDRGIAASLRALENARAA